MSTPAIRREVQRWMRKPFPVLAHAEVTAGICDECQTRPATTHVAYQPQEAPRFAHYCEQCSQRMPNGWLVVTSFGKPAKASKAATVA